MYIGERYIGEREIERDGALSIVHSPGIRKEEEGVGTTEGSDEERIREGQGRPRERRGSENPL